MIFYFKDSKQSICMLDAHNLFKIIKKVFKKIAMFLKKNLLGEQIRFYRYQTHSEKGVSTRNDLGVDMYMYVYLPSVK